MNLLTIELSQLVPRKLFALWRTSQPGAVLGYWLLLVLWLLSMIAVPIVRWVVSDDALPWAVSLSVVIQAAAVLTALWQSWGARRVGRAILLLLPLAWLLEFVGSSTGLPFGHYQYTERLLPQVGHVPLLIPLAWLMMLPCAWAVAEIISGASRGWRFVVLSALVFTAWDLFLDPQMVLWGFWVWEQPGGYFGIPWLNFGGWFVGAALFTWLASRLVRVHGLPIQPLLFVYTATWLLETAGLFFFWELPGPATVGFLVMGLFVFLALTCTQRASLTPVDN